MRTLVLTLYQCCRASITTIECYTNTKNALSTRPHSSNHCIEIKLKIRMLTKKKKQRINRSLYIPFVKYNQRKYVFKAVFDEARNNFMLYANYTLRITLYLNPILDGTSFYCKLLRSLLPRGILLQKEWFVWNRYALYFERRK